MRRKVRKLFVNFAFFGCALFCIVYLNRRHSNATVFAWTKVRYQTTSTSLPEARGICPGLAGSSKPALVVGRVAADGDPRWLDKLSKLYHLCVYSADAVVDPNSRFLQVPANRGHEAMAYLTFLIDNYSDIPAAGAVFVHGSRWAWHNDAPDYDNAALLATLNVSSALGSSGYHNLRCDWSAGMCSPSSTSPQRSLEVSMSAMLEPWNARAVSDAALPQALAVLFGGEMSIIDSNSIVNEQALNQGVGRTLLSRTDVLRSQCCAQFVVARDRVWRHSRDEYVALRQWLLDGARNSGTNEQSSSGEAAPRDDRVAGRILSYVWHILFLEQNEIIGQDESTSTNNGIDLNRLNILACPRADDCYCRLYGRCDLAGCESPGYCNGQYVLPKDYALRKDWAATHS